VPVAEARRWLPPDLPIVEAFGHTLGGLYLARYDDSPCGAFDEAVVLAGLVWDGPLSSAWAGRVYVDAPEARDHGRRCVGLPSRLASFATGENATVQLPSSSSSIVSGAAVDAWTGRRRAPRPVGVGAPSWWRAQARPWGHRDARPAGAPQCPLWPERRGGGRRHDGAEVLTSSAPSQTPQVGPDGHRGGPPTVDDGLVSLRVVGPAGVGLSPCGHGEVAALRVPPARPPLQWPGPRLKLSLPSFSGRTPDVPRLLWYACDLTARIRLSAPVVVERLPPAPATSGAPRHPEDVGGILGGRPLICLRFDDMSLRVEEPAPLATGRDQGRTGRRGGRRAAQPVPA